MDEWMQIAQTQEIKPGTSKVIQRQGFRVAVFNVNGQFYAVDAINCPLETAQRGKAALEGCAWREMPSALTYKVRTDGEVVQIAVPQKEEEQHRRREVLEDTVPQGVGEPDIMAQILASIHRGKTFDEALENIYVGLQQIVEHNRLGLAFIDAVNDKLVFVKAKSDRTILLNTGFSVRVAGSVFEQMFKSGKPSFIDDLHQTLAEGSSTWAQFLVEEGMRSNLMFPLFFDQTPAGVMFFASTVPCAFSSEQVELLSRIAREVAISFSQSGRWVSDLAQSNAQFRLFFDSCDDGIFICPAPDQPFVTFNDNLCTWLGYSRTELSNLLLHNLMSDKEFRRIKRLLESLLPNAEPIVFQTEFIRKDGSTLPLEIRAVLFSHRGTSLIHGFAHDRSEVKALHERLKSQYAFEGVIGKNRKMVEIYEFIQQIAPLSTTILLQGESGTGKDLVAKAVHHKSSRKQKPFVRVNCGALVDNLLESELFGHVKGAFTGATVTRKGRFEMADGGTLFLDEIGELSPATQPKLLRVLQDGEFEKVGSTTTQKADVRVIAATNRDLLADIDAGRFRQDLYYRLNVVKIVLPPLRERRDDIPLLITHFIEKFNRQTQKSIMDVSPEVYEILMEYPYPGNVRQLENIIEHAFVKCDTEFIEKKHLPAELTDPMADILTLALMSEKPLATLEQELIRKVLAQCDGSLKLGAKRLGISRTTLWRRLKMG
ncbi:MAG: sigma 54-interacting transcriptional regulator [Candidatus Poribacteria bacterium]|nr:sigma 54-interacting transcriptional regulator [Candidatus Poribacteria bacterium]